MKTVGILLITVALIAGMVSCAPTPTPTPEYDLTIASTEGGNVTTPGEGTFAYDEGTVVNLTAGAEAGYRFVSWTGNVSTMGNVSAAATIITVNGNYSITANFGEIPPVQYHLTVNSTEGGNVTTPGEGTFTYDEGAVVILVAVAEEGCFLTGWTGDVDTLVVGCPAMPTTITMNGNYEIAANFAAMYGNYSDLLEHVITSQGDIILKPGTEVNPSTGNHSPEEYYGGAWPTAEELAAWYFGDVEDEEPYGSDTVDLNGVDQELGPFYRDGELEIVNTSDTPATLTLTGTGYITGDTLIGTTGKDFTIDLNGYTIFVASNSSDLQKAFWMGGKCTLVGEGAVIAVGDIYFEPMTEAGVTDPVFIMSVCDTISFQVGGDFYGSIAGSVEIQLQPGTSINYPETEGWYSGINFPGCTL